jgi:hypothetical protein
MSLLYDTGALLRLERGDRSQWRRFDNATDAGVRTITHGGV